MSTPEQQNIYQPKKKNIYIKKQALNINEQEKQKVYEIYMKEFNENFQNILLEPKEIFIKNINLEVDLILNEVFQKREKEELTKQLNDLIDQVSELNLTKENIEKEISQLKEEKKTYKSN